MNALLCKQYRLSDTMVYEEVNLREQITALTDSNRKVAGKVVITN